MERTIENVKKLVASGKSIHEMATIFGITDTPMRYWMKKRGIRPNGVRYKHSDEEIIKAVAVCASFRQVLRELGMNEAGGNFSTLKKRIADLDIDISHFKGRGWNRGGVAINAYSADDVLRRGTTYRRGLVRKKFLKFAGVEEKCSKCGLSQWNNAPLVLELDHINGERDDNRVENLRLLCPNCHSQTKGWRGRK